MSRIYLSPPSVGSVEREALLRAFDSNWIAPLGPEVDEFERELAQAVGVGHAAALSSGTAALHLALLMLGVGRGDRVLVPTFTFAATANAVAYVGAQPEFVDCDAETWTADPAIVSEVVERGGRERRPYKAVVTVDLYGQCANYDAIVPVCKGHGIPVIQDAAEALGAQYAGKPAGAQGDVAVFSFNGNKIITTSGGGMLVADDESFVARARYLASQARQPAPHYEHSEIGYNYRLSNLLAAMGRAQLGDLERRVQRRRAVFERYKAGLGDLVGVSFMPEAGYGRHTRWLSCMLIEPSSGVTREKVRVALEGQNIEARPLWKPMHMQSAFRGAPSHGGAVAEGLFERGLCLPSGTDLTSADQERIVEIVRGCWSQRRSA